MNEVLGEGRILIDNELVEAEGDLTYPNVNPATEEVIGQVADSSQADADSPFGVYKSSGIGRQGAFEGFERYLETRTIALPIR